MSRPKQLQDLFSLFANNPIRWVLTNSPEFAIFNSTAFIFRHERGDLVKIHLVAMGARFNHLISGSFAGSGRALRSCSLRTGLMRRYQMCHECPFLTYQKHGIILYHSFAYYKIQFKKAMSPRCLAHPIKTGDSRTVHCRTGFCRYKHSAKLSQRCDKYSHGTGSVQ